MSKPGLRLRHIAFHGPDRERATLKFGPGLNVLYGASETGKSFIVEAIDFMLGGKPPLRDLPERVGYDRVLLGMETTEGEEFTIRRSVDGGSFRLYSGLHIDPPGEDVESRELSEKHTDKSADNLSRFLLQRCALDEQRVKINKHGVTNSLSFRNVARLLIVTETEITKQRSPLSDGNPTTDTPNFSTFKLMLTGVDDSALVVSKPKTAEDQSRNAQLELLDQLLGEYYERLKELTNNPGDLEDQLERVDTSLSQHTAHLATTEGDFRRLADQRRDLRKKLEEGRDRRSEITGLLERFDLLERHYNSDVERLRGIEEGGSLFEVLGQAPCPLCGAEPGHQRRDADCDGNIMAVVEAARAETAKIELLRSELGETVFGLRREAVSFDRRLPKIEEELKALSEEVDRFISPKLARLRTSYSELADKRGHVREALSVFRTIQDIEARRTRLDTAPEEKKESSVSDGDLPAAVAESFAQQVETILKQWNLPEAERVYFDAKSRDLIIAGKARGARGKGLRAITHAAFTIGLLDYCKSKDKPHPGFVILDSPLLAYREPEGLDDDLRGTDVKDKFYDYLSSVLDDRQIIIIENNDPPPMIVALPQVAMFSKNPNSGRYGFFPRASDAPGEIL